MAHAANMTAMTQPTTRRDRVALTDPLTYKTWLYLFLGLPFGVLWFSLLVPLYATSTALVIVWVGLPMLVLTHLLSRGIGHVERGLLNGLVDAGIPAPHRLPKFTPKNAFSTVMRDGFAWRNLGWSAMRLLLGPIGFVLAIVSFVVPLALVAAPISFFFDQNDDLGGWENLFWLGPFVGIPLMFLMAIVVRATGDLMGRLGNLMLGPTADELAAELDDRSERVEARLRLDQELHDSIGHVLTMTVVQAGAGVHVFDSDPEFARTALSTIEEQGRDALDELDRIIALVRSDQLERLEVPGYEAIPALIERTRRAGNELEASIAEAQVPPAVGRAAYRIVQESITNAVKHGAPGPMTIEVAATDQAIEITVENPLRESVSAVAGGRGIPNMADRTAQLGGTLSAGPTDAGTFRVAAILPKPTGGTV